LKEQSGNPGIREEFDGLIRRIGIYSWATIGALIVVIAGVYVLIEGRVIFAPLFAALIVVFVLNPFVTALQRRGVHRIVGALIGFLSFVAILIVIGLLVVPSIVDQARGFGTEFPVLYDRFVEQIVTLGQRFGLDSSIWSRTRAVPR